MSFWQWMFQILVALDQLANTVFCRGYADETMSSAVYRMERDGRFWGRLRRVVDAVMFFDPIHCYRSYLAGLERAKTPPENRP